MNIGYVPKLTLMGSESPLKADLMGSVRKIQTMDAPEGPSFQQVVSHTLNSVNTVMNAPNELMHKAMTGASVDVHDVMIADAQASTMLSITAQVATKVIQAYDKILQIQI